MKVAVLAILLGIVIGSTPARADVPQTMTFTARLTDGDAVLEGTHSFGFRLFDAATGGNQLWTETHASIPVEDGMVTVALGSNAPLTTTVLGGSPLWVEVVLDGDTMTPRLALRSVPYATRAGDAALLDGAARTAFAPVAHDHDAAYVDTAGDTMTGGLNLGGDLQLASKVALRGTDTWLRLNQDGAFTSGIHSPYNLNASGVTVGALYFDPGAGNLDVQGTGWLRGGGRFNGIAVGSAPFGALTYPYETIQLDPSFNLRFAFGTEERMRLHSDGRLWMSTTAGDCPSGWFCNGMFWDLSVASILYSGLSQRSDARLKKDVEPIANGLEVVRALRPVTFTWRDPATPGRQHGFIAQEVEEVVPSLVTTTTDGMLALDTQEMLPILMQAVKELDAQNAELRAEVAALRAGQPSPAGMGRSAGSASPSLATLAGFGAVLLLVLAIAGRSRRRG